MEEESQLLSAAQNLDEAALLTIYDRFAPRVYAYALKQCHDPGLADDIVGRVFAQFLDELSAGNGPRSGLQDYFYRSAAGHAQRMRTGGE